MCANRFKYSALDEKITLRFSRCRRIDEEGGVTMSHIAGWFWTIVVLLVMLMIPAKSYRMLLLVLVFPFLLIAFLLIV
jgi:hypothetical protein